MIRVVELIAPFDTGGAERQLAETAARLDRSRFSVHAIALTRGGPTEALLERSKTRSGALFEAESEARKNCISAQDSGNAFLQLVRGGGERGRGR
mgnify:CR=1 FL=1